MEGFGAHIHKLRKQKGLTLKQVEKLAHVSNAYLSLLERGLRRPPRPEILQRMAQVYQVEQRELMIAAGYLQEGSEEKREKQELEQTYKHALLDPNFKYGTRLQGAPVSLDVKRFVVEMYQRARQRNLMKHP